MGEAAEHGTRSASRDRLRHCNSAWASPPSTCRCGAGSPCGGAAAATSELTGTTMPEGRTAVRPAGVVSRCPRPGGRNPAGRPLTGRDHQRRGRRGLPVDWAIAEARSSTHARCPGKRRSQPGRRPRGRVQSPSKRLETNLDQRLIEVPARSLKPRNQAPSRWFRADADRRLAFHRTQEAGGSSPPSSMPGKGAWLGENTEALSGFCVSRSSRPRPVVWTRRGRRGD